MIVTCENCGKKKEVKDDYFDDSTYSNPEELYFCSDCEHEINKLILSFEL